MVICTVTLNPAVDKTVVIPDFSVGVVNRIQDVRIDAGGKGINVSKCLKNLGMDSTVGTVLGGSSGTQVLTLAKELGLNVLSVPVSGETRTNVKIVDTVRHENTDINEAGPEVPEEDLRNLRDSIASRITPGDLLILSGSLSKGAPATLYRQWVDFFKTLGAKVILDADGEPMRQGVLAKPCLIKPNDVELSGLAGEPLTTDRQLIAAGERLLRAGVGEVLISRAEKGAIYLSEEGTYQADGLRVSVLSTVGAGDAMVAAMAYGFVKNMSAPDRLRLATAMGAASVMCSGTQPPAAALVWELFEQVHIQEV